VLFLGNPRAVQVAHLRYLENSLRRTFAFEGTPIRWITKNKSNREVE
jgi:predicted GTPase